MQEPFPDTCIKDYNKDKCGNNRYMTCSVGVFVTVFDKKENYSEYKGDRKKVIVDKVRDKSQLCTSLNHYKIRITFLQGGIMQLYNNIISHSAKFVKE